MNKLWLKIIGIAVLVIVVATAAYIFWPAESRDAGKAQQGERLGLEAHKDIAESGPPAGAEDEYYYEAKRIPVEYPGSTQPGQKEYVSRDRPRLRQGRHNVARRTPSQYPVAAESKEEAEKLMEQWELQRKQEAAAEQQRNVEQVQAIIASQIIERVRPELPEGAEIELTDEEIEQIHQEAIETVLEQYKDNPEQAEELKKILLERLEHFRKLRDTAKEKEPPSE